METPCGADVKSVGRGQCDQVCDMRTWHILVVVMHAWAVQEAVVDDSNVFMQRLP
jgi:hypothetical protein